MEKIELPEGFGLATYEVTKNNASKTYIKVTALKEGEHVFRVMPPMKSQALTGKWSQYYVTHSGYATPNPSKPEGMLYNTFLCPAQTKFSKQSAPIGCAECNKVAEMKEIEALYTNKMKTNPEQYETLLSPISAWIEAHWLEKKHYINVMLPDRSFQVLKLPHRTKQMIDNLFKDLKTNEEIDPTDLREGVWVIVKQPKGRIGKMPNPELPIVSIKRNKNGTERVPLTLEEAKQALEQCIDLVEDRFKIAREVTMEQVELLTKSSGEPEELLSIFEGDPKTLQALKNRYKNSKSLYEMNEAELKKQMAYDDKIPF